MDATQGSGLKGYECEGLAIYILSGKFNLLSGLNSCQHRGCFLFKNQANASNTSTRVANTVPAAMPLMNPHSRLS